MLNRIARFVRGWLRRSRPEKQREGEWGLSTETSGRRVKLSEWRDPREREAARDRWIKRRGGRW
jgi:hypothetical protein